MKTEKPQNELRRFARSTDSGIRIDPSSAVKDSNTLLGMPPRNPEDDQLEFRKGGKIKRTGSVKAHKGEQVVKRASAEKYGDKKMAAVNRGSAIVKTGKR